MKLWRKLLTLIKKKSVLSVRNMTVSLNHDIKSQTHEEISQCLFWNCEAKPANEVEKQQ